MPSITVRDVPDEARNELAARAARSGRSLQEFLRSELIELASRPDAHELMQRVRHRKTHAPEHVTSAQILLHRDADRR